MKRKTKLHAFLLGCSPLLVITSLHAADVTWDTAPGTVGAGDSAITGGAGTWDLANGNWTTDGGATNVAWNNAGNDTAIFGGTAGTVLLGANVTVGGLTFTTNNYNLNPVATEEVILGADSQLNVTTGTAFIRTPISETGGARKLTKIGNGTVELFGASSFTGGLEIDAGVVRAMGGGNSFGAAGTTITIDGGQIHGRNTQVHEQGILLNQTDTAFVKGNNGFWEFTGAVSGTGGLTVNDSGSYGARRLKFSSTSNTFTGAINMTNNSALLHVNSLADTGGGNIVFDGSTAGFALGEGTATSITLNNRQIEMTAVGGINRIGNENTDSTLNILTINTDLLVSAATGVGSKTLQLEGANTGDNAFNGLIANGVFDTLNVSKSGAGKWILGNANTYNGTTTISTSGSTLVGTDPQAFGTNLSGITMAGGTNLSLRNDSSVTFGVGVNGYNINNSASGATINVDRVTGTGPNTITVGNLTTTSTAGSWTLNFTGANDVSLSAGTLTAPAATAATTHTINNNIDATNGASLTLADINEPSTDTAPVLNFTGSGITNVTGAITQTTAALALTKNGAGVLALSGTNSYEGTTNVNDGTLLVNGSTAAASAVSVGGGATLGGSGTIAGDVSVAATANLAPGASVGTLSIGGGLDISALAGDTGLLEYDLGPIAASDKIEVTGTLEIGSGELGFSDFDFSNAGGLTDGVYTLITSGTLSGTLDGTDLDGTIGAFGATLGTSGNNIILTVGTPSGTPYELWATGGELFGDDANGDGVSNGLAFLLGAANPDVSALDKLPVVTETGGGLVMTFDMLDSASRGTAALSVEHSSDLGIADPWSTPVAVPDATPAPQVPPIDFQVSGGPGTLSVIATISSSEAAGGKLFGRLKATE